ncbi:MAG: HEAT repeat domain-containing protein [Spirochaetota bacterium]
MNRSLIFVSLLVLLATAFPGLGDESADLWAMLYEKTESLDQKHQVVLNMYEQDNPALVPVLVTVLDDMVRLRGGLSLKEREIQREIQVLAIRKLADFRAAEAAPLIYEAMWSAEDPFLKSEAISALGKVGARMYAEPIARMLKNLNFYRGERLQEEEAIAYACVVALERFGDPVGYLPVLFASTAGYSRRVKEAAERAMAGMVEDPSPILLDFIRNEPDFKNKLRGVQIALQAGFRSASKAEVAVEALRQGIINKPMDRQEVAVLRDIRLAGLQALISLRPEEEQSIHLIERIFYLRGTDQSEVLHAVEALGGYRSDEAAKALARFLGHQNDRQASGVTAVDNRLVIATIRALGRTGNRLGYEELMRVKYAGYPSGVVREAEQVLQKL